MLSFTNLGSGWVLWVLVALSIISIAVMVERALAMSASARPFDIEGLGPRLLGLLGKGDVAAAREVLGRPAGPEVRVALAGLAEFERGRTATSEAMASAKSRERLGLEKYLGVLGTLGNNAPFIGLFGTVLGIIKAFADLSRNRGGGAEAVMAGISEALVATAVGLLVAIPAVIGFNVFQGKVRRAMGRVDAMAHLILSALGDPEPRPAPAAERAETAPRAKA